MPAREGEVHVPSSESSSNTSDSNAPGSVDVVGAGIVGSAIAWAVARAGYAVRLFDPLLAEDAAQTGASWAAGGMLAPFSEGWPGEDDVLALGAASLRRWPGLADRLRGETGVDVVTARGTVMVAADGADAEELRTVRDWLVSRDASAPDSDRASPRALTRSEVREAHPSLAKNLRGGLRLESEMAIDNRRLLSALRLAARQAGAALVPSRLAAVDDSGADHVVVTAGTDVSDLLPGIPVRPVKGEILRLRRRPSAPEPPECTVRATVHGRHVYIVPRPDGVVVGATMYEHGDDRQVTVGGVRDLIADAQAVLPSIAEYELVDAMAGLRPMTPDNLPVVGRLEVGSGGVRRGGSRAGPDVIAAAGHGRNGVLMTAITVDAVLAELAGTAMPEIECARPGRSACR